MKSKPSLIIIIFLFVSFCNGQTIDSTKEVPMVIEVMPEYPGGTQEMMNYIKKNVNLSKLPIRKNTKIKGFYKFVIDRTGSVSEVTALKPAEDCPECDEEAARVLKSMPKWKPGLVGGKPVAVFFNIPINFSK